MLGNDVVGTEVGIMAKHIVTVVGAPPSPTIASPWMTLQLTSLKLDPAETVMV